MRTLSKWLAAIVAAAVIAGPAAAADQTIRTHLTLSDFNNSSIKVAFKTTDAFDSVRTCNAGSGSSCSAQNGYGSPPKNVGNVLCIPDQLLFAITASCQQILSQGAGKCEKNNLSSWCPASGFATVAPACNWRTNDNKNAVSWSSSLT